MTDYPETRAAAEHYVKPLRSHMRLAGYSTHRIEAGNKALDDFVFALGGDFDAGPAEAGQSIEEALRLAGHTCHRTAGTDCWDEDCEICGDCTVWPCKLDAFPHDPESDLTALGGERGRREDMRLSSRLPNSRIALLPETRGRHRTGRGDWTGWPSTRALIEWGYRRPGEPVCATGGTSREQIEQIIERELDFEVEIVWRWKPGVWFPAHAGQRVPPDCPRCGLMLNPDGTCVRSRCRGDGGRPEWVRSGEERDLRKRGEL